MPPCFVTGSIHVDFLISIPLRHFFKYFLYIAPDDSVIDQSLLRILCRLRLKDVNLLDMLIHKKGELHLKKDKSKSITLARTREEVFEFNMDAGMYVCKVGHMVIRTALTNKRIVRKNQRQTYYFHIEKCRGYLSRRLLC
ncbi:hypothetical protein SAMN05518872_102179 [Psychrobacillus sp. OK032]|nr:hypothetical protein SAMN05518872_102179 [Psychrobacillus sp. OK032]